jgi:TonB-linked SusC/RagA family outer membrane protein
MFMKVSLAQNESLSSLRTLSVTRLFAFAFSVLVIIFFSFPAQAQNNVRVHGRITNETGQPLAKVSVVVKGSTQGTTSNDNGDFEIDAPSSGVLVLSSVGYASKEVAVQQNVAVTLSALAGNLNEVVVVGYGTQRKRDVTGSVASVSGATLKEVPSPNLIDQLKGRTAGVDIVSNGATPGSSGSIRIRGNRTITNSRGTSDALDQPLLVLDGIPFGGSINDLNPEDIASIDILKDASATAIYGSRGAGGVILVTTKRGRTGKPVVSYDAYYGISSVMGKLKVFNGTEYAQFKQDAATYNRSAPGTTAYPLTPAEQQALAAGISTDWQDLIYQNGFTTNHQLGLTGGNEGAQYGLSGGYYNQTGIIPNQKFERYSLRATIDARVNSRIKVGLNTLNTLSYINTPGGAGVPGGTIRVTPLAAPYNADGSVNIRPAVGSIDEPNIVSPLTLKSKSDAILARTRRLRTFNSLYGEVQILKELRYRINVGLDYRQEQADSYNGPNTFTNATSTSFSQANANVRNAEAWSYVVENLLYYDKTIKDKHKIGFTGLFSAQKDHSKQSSFNGLGFPADYVQNSNLSLANTVTAAPPFFGAPQNFLNEQGLLSFMGRINYSFNNRFLATATVRRDGSSVLAEGHQYFTYPAFGLGWNLGNEGFMSNLAFVNTLKIRGGWGRTGNQGVAPYSTLGALTTSTYNFGQGSGGQQAAYTVTQLANNELHWQSTDQWNVGLDFAVLKSRLTGSIDVYEQKTKDILLPYQLPPSNGASSTTKNLGQTKGNGLEINLSSINIQSKNGLVWTTDFNFFYNREEITFLTNEGNKQDIQNGWFVGQPLSVIYDVKKIGIWQTSDSAKGILAAQTSPVQFPGQIRVQDLNGDGKIDQNDRQILGKFEPDWEAGMTNRVTYKNFDFSIVIFARMGMKVVVPYITADGGAQGFPFFMQGRANQLKVDYWTRSNPTNEFPAPDAGTDRFLFASTLGYRDGSFIKCRSINLGYEIPTSALKKAGISSLRVYVTALNPFIFYSPFVKDGLGPDPEGNGYGNAVSSPTAGGSVGPGGVAGELNQQSRVITVNANNPSTRQFNIGINLKF